MYLMCTPLGASLYTGVFSCAGKAPGIFLCHTWSLGLLSPVLGLLLPRPQASLIRQESKA